MRSCVLFGFVFVLLFSLASAQFSVSSNFEKPLVIEPGESKELSFNLRTEIGEETFVEARVVEGGEIARIVGDPVRKISSDGSVVNVLFSGSEEFSGERIVRVLFRPQAQEGGEGVQILTAIGEKISVIVPGEMQKNLNVESEEENEEEFGQSPAQTLETNDAKDLFDKNFIFVVISLIVAGIVLYLIKTKY